MKSDGNYFCSIGSTRQFFAKTFTIKKIVRNWFDRKKQISDFYYWIRQEFIKVIFHILKNICWAWQSTKFSVEICTLSFSKLLFQNEYTIIQSFIVIWNYTFGMQISQRWFLKQRFSLPSCHRQLSNNDHLIFAWFTLRRLPWLCHQIRKRKRL